MLFSQLTFFVFLAVVLIGHWLTRFSRIANNLFLLAASWAFFAYWSLADFVIFLVIIFFTYPLLAGIDRLSPGKPRRLLLGFSLSTSLTTLAFFKYRHFLGANILYFLKSLGVVYQPPSDSIAIPLAISFYTFHLIILAWDVYQGKYRTPSFLTYCLYLSFFPHILAGPIVRGDELLGQIETHPRDRVVDWVGAIYVFCVGLFFKVVIADNISEAIDPYWTAAGFRNVSTLDTWCVILLYSCQIFADFGGYSFMAIGLGKMFGIELPENFNAPYLATSFREFWHRWHITLSRFLRDYLYIAALGGNRCAKWRMQLNLIVTMLLGGLWHGPAWTFIVWGGIHGCGLAIERWLGFTDKARKSLLSRASWCVAVQLGVIVAWALFRSPDMRFALKFLRRMFLLSQPSFTLTPTLAAALLLIVPVIVHHFWRASESLGTWTQSLLARGALTGAVIYLICVFFHAPRGFIYFVF